LVAGPLIVGFAEVGDLRDGEVGATLVGPLLALAAADRPRAVGNLTVADGAREERARVGLNVPMIQKREMRGGLGRGKGDAVAPSQTSPRGKKEKWGEVGCGRRTDRG